MTETKIPIATCTVVMPRWACLRTVWGREQKAGEAKFFMMKSLRSEWRLKIKGWGFKMGLSHCSAPWVRARVRDDAGG